MKNEEKNDGVKKNKKKFIIIGSVALAAVVAFSTCAYVTSIDSSSNATDNKLFNKGAKVDKKKCLNDDESNFSSIDSNEKLDGLKISYEGDNAFLNVNSKKLKLGADLTDGKYEISGISKKNIKNYYIGTIGQDGVGVVVLFSTKDGNVKYFKVVSDNKLNLTYNKFNAIKIDGISDIVSFYGAIVTSKSGKVPEYHTLIASKRDGSFYNLAKFIKGSSIDLTKCINDSDNNFSDVHVDSNDYGIRIQYYNNKPLLNIENSALSNNTLNVTDGVYTVEGISQNDIKLVYTSGIGQDISGDIVFFLMKDGTIKYVKVINSNGLNLTNGYFVANTVDNIDYITSLYTVTATPKNSPVGSYQTVIALTKDGTFYNLDKNINSSVSTTNTTTVTTNTTTTNTTTTNTTTQTASSIDLSKPINCGDYDYVDVTDSSQNFGLSVVPTNYGASLVIDFSKFGNIASKITNGGAYGDVDVYEISGLNGKVLDGFVGGVGQTALGTYVFLRMENGSIMYFPMFATQRDSHGNVYNVINYNYVKDSNGRVTSVTFKALGPIPNITGITKLYNASGSKKGQLAGGGATVLGMKQDGSFYDLGLLINK